MIRQQFTFYRSFWEAIESLPKKDKADVLCAICSYALDGEVPSLSGAPKAMFALIRPTLDSSARKAENRLNKKKTKTEEEQSENKQGTEEEQNGNEDKNKDEGEREYESESEKESECEGECEGENECSPPLKGPPPHAPEAKKDPRHKYGEYGWVRLTQAEYDRLLRDLGIAELERCIRYVDESAQKSGNKNRWKDWNLVLRSCHREGWGIRAGASARNAPPAGNWPETPPAGEMDRMEDMLKRMGGGG